MRRAPHQNPWPPASSLKEEMLKPHLLAPNRAPSLFLSQGTLPSSHRSSSLGLRPTAVKLRKVRKRDCIRCASREVPSSSSTVVGDEAVTLIRTVATVKMTVGGLLSDLGLSRALDDITDLVGKSLLLELVSAEVDPGKRSSVKLMLVEA